MDLSSGRSRRLLQEYGRDSKHQRQQQEQEEELHLPRWLQTTRYPLHSEVSATPIDSTGFPPYSAPRVLHSNGIGHRDGYAAVPYLPSSALHRDRVPSIGHHLISADDPVRSILSTLPSSKDTVTLAYDYARTSSDISGSLAAQARSNISRYGQSSNPIASLEVREARLSLIDRYGSALPMQSTAVPVDGYRSSDIPSVSGLLQRPSMALQSRFYGQREVSPVRTMKSHRPQKKRALAPTGVIEKKKKGEQRKNVAGQKKGGEQKKEGVELNKEEQANGKVDTPVEGMIFGCNDKTKRECKRLQLFGLPSNHKNEVLRVVPGSKLFLFDYDSKHLTGIFEATCRGAIDIVPDAFKFSGSFPAQVRIKRVMKVPSLPMEKFKEAVPEVFYKEKKFKHELNSPQVAKLVEMFVSTKETAKA
ncbi:hypothetical protein O6H91_08G092400 [Diphasiastrum complanatum]|uniref:Uncharacterized protein n=1 Tax=Diphasiastrum complanatum TaxID=34168 RepID=A0ACC2CZZ0_DIPCM|nr:hypothetical protein O6H91_08G092400 [Diphasiastrum complanatum]